MKVIASSLLFLIACAGRAAAQTPPSASAAAPVAAASAATSAPASPAAVAADAPAGVAVVKFKWERVPRRTEWDTALDSAANQSVEDPRFSGPLTRDVSVGRVPNPVGRSSAAAVRDRSQIGRNTTTAGGVNEQAQPAQKPMPGRPGSDEYLYRLRLKNEGGRRVESVDWEYIFLDPETKKELGRHRFVSRRRAKPGETFTLDAPSASPPARIVSAAVLDKKRAKPFDERVIVRCVAYSDGTFARRDGADETDCEAARSAAARAGRKP